jgi:ligand-binding SRPBCC domain-containing protein
MQVTASITIRCPCERAFAFCASMQGFCRQFPLAIDWRSGEAADWSVASKLDFRFRLLGVWLPYVAEITSMDHGRSFTDVMLRGPYEYRRHRHVFEAISEGLIYTDIVDFSMGLGDWLDCRVFRALEQRTLKQRPPSEAGARVRDITRRGS